MTIVWVLSVLCLLGVWITAVVDVLTRHDLSPANKTLMLAVLVLLSPVTIVYVLGRPVSAVRFSRHVPRDWRSDLVDRLEGGTSSGAGDDRQLVGKLRGALGQGIDAARPSRPG